MGPAAEKVGWLLAAAACSALLSGCVLHDFTKKGDAAPPTGPVCQLVPTWSKEVAFVPDPANGGVARPGLSGRIYLFGSQIDYPLAGDGTLTVEVIAPETVAAAAGQPAKTEWRVLENWTMDKPTLARLLRKDMIGWGYTLFLPWGTYRPDITLVRLKLRYDPPGGMPLYSESTLTLTRGK